MACTELSCPRHGERNRRARELQAAGPDMFPFGYYQHLADVELVEEKWQRLADQPLTGKPGDTITFPVVQS